MYTIESYISLVVKFSIFFEESIFYACFAFTNTQTRFAYACMNVYESKHSAFKYFEYVGCGFSGKRMVSSSVILMFCEKKRNTLAKCLDLEAIEIRIRMRILKYRMKNLICESVAWFEDHSYVCV